MAIEPVKIKDWFLCHESAKSDSWAEGYAGSFCSDVLFKALTPGDVARDSTFHAYSSREKAMEALEAARRKVSPYQPKKYPAGWYWLSAGWCMGSLAKDYLGAVLPGSLHTRLTPGRLGTSGQWWLYDSEDEAWAALREAERKLAEEKAPQPDVVVEEDPRGVPWFECQLDSNPDNWALRVEYGNFLQAEDTDLAMAQWWMAEWQKRPINLLLEPGECDPGLEQYPWFLGEYDEEADEVEQHPLAEIPLEVLDQLPHNRRKVMDTIRWFYWPTRQEAERALALALRKCREKGLTLTKETL